MPFELTLDESGRVSQTEGKTREYKLNLASKDRVLQAVVAFANSAGGESSSRNLVLARIFRELDLIEEWGTGIPEVVRSLDAVGLPEPDFYQRRERIRITVHIQNHDPLKYRVQDNLGNATTQEHQGEQRVGA
ncbi:MAG: hypothetical protein LBJ02_04605 [Bifidobacteriaceae bacterium]|jgi:predicted HTH transcriptional regulator|nr:hypothetical protein [Bifidobacteriaceae bacterium]